MSTEVFEALDATAFARRRLGFDPDPAQEKVLRVTSRRGILNCSRQWGKTTVSAVKALHCAASRENALVLVASPSARQSSIFVHKVRDLTRRLGEQPRGDGENEISVLLRNGSRIVGLPGREDTTRGYSNPDLLLIDEAARVPDELYDGLVPSLAGGRGSLWLLSTPAGKRGFFWREWQSGGQGWVRVSVPAPECPRISPKFLEEERARKSERIFEQEYLCCFLDAEGALFREDDVQACIDDEVPMLWANTGAGLLALRSCPAHLLSKHPRYYVGVDLGQSQDYSAVTIVERNELAHRERDPVTYAFRTETRFHLRYAERAPLGTPYTEIADWVKSLVSREPLAGNSTVIADGTGVGAPVVDLLKKAKLGCRLMPVVITSGVAEGSDAMRFRVPKKDLIAGLQTAFERRSLRISAGLGALEELMGELRSMRTRRRGEGYERYSGFGHDDLVLALSLAWWRARAEGAR